MLAILYDWAHILNDTEHRLYEIVLRMNEWVLTHCEYSLSLQRKLTPTRINVHS